MAINASSSIRSPAEAELALGSAPNGGCIGVDRLAHGPSIPARSSQVLEPLPLVPAIWITGDSASWGLADSGQARTTRGPAFRSISWIAARASVPASGRSCAAASWSRFGLCRGGLRFGRRAFGRQARQAWGPQALAVRAPGKITAHGRGLLHQHPHDGDQLPRAISGAA